MADASNPQLQRYELWSNGVALEHAERGGWVKYEDALAAIERLRAALEQYGRHDNGCPSVMYEGPPPKCDCGGRVEVKTT